MKLLRIVPSMNPEDGGVVEAINQFAAHADRSRYTLDVLCLDEPDSSWISAEKRFQIIGLGGGMSSYNISLRLVAWVWRYADTYDVVIIDGIWQFSVMCGYVLKLRKVPYCVFIHGMLDPYFNEDRLKYLKKLPFWFLIERHVIALAHATIFTCEEESALAARSFPCYKSRARIAALGIQPSSAELAVSNEIFLEKFPEAKGKKVILFLSRIHPKKGVDLLLAAFRSLGALADEYILAIAGPGDNAYIRQLQAGDGNQDSRIIWCGMLKGLDKWSAFKNADIFVLPSHQENFGIVLAEALACGTPVITTNKVNIWQEISGREAGLIAEDTVTGIASNLTAWITMDEAAKSDYRTNAEQCFLEAFSINASVTQLQGILEDVAH